MQKATRRALTAWRYEAAAACAARQAAEYMVRSWQLETMRLTLTCWREETQLTRSERQAAADAFRAQRSLGVLWRCMAAWRDHRRQMHALRTTAEDYGQARESALEHSIIAAWKQLAKAEPPRRESLMQAFRVSADRRVLASAFSSWQALRAAIRAAHHRAGELHAVLTSDALRAAFLMWRLVSASTASSQQLRSQRTAKAFAARRLRAVLRAWAGASAGRVGPPCFSAECECGLPFGFPEQAGQK
jgi:hypothetical protein